jgi:hypothetical protein
VNVTVVQRELRGERTMRTRTCIEAADFVALSVALAVDPSLEASLPTPAPSNEQKPTDPSFPPADDAHANEESDNQSPSEASPTEKAAVPVAPSENSPPDQKAAMNARWYVQAGASFDAFSFPSARFGGTAEIGIDIERVSISGGATWLPPVTESVPSAQSDVAFSRLTGQLRVSYLSTWGSLELSPYLEGQAGQVFAEAVDASYRSRALWLALGAGAQVSWPARNQVQLYGATGALFPLNQSTFELSGGTEVHTVPPVTFEADIGLRINF